jgi:hypothetical protein
MIRIMTMMGTTMSIQLTPIIIIVNNQAENNDTHNVSKSRKNRRSFCLPLVLYYHPFMFVMVETTSLTRYVDVQSWRVRLLLWSVRLTNVMGKSLSEMRVR